MLAATMYIKLYCILYIVICILLIYVNCNCILSSLIIVFCSVWSTLLKNFTHYGTCVVSGVTIKDSDSDSDSMQPADSKAAHLVLSEWVL